MLRQRSPARPGKQRCTPCTVHTTQVVHPHPYLLQMAGGASANTQQRSIPFPVALHMRKAVKRGPAGGSAHQGPGSSAPWSPGGLGGGYETSVVAWSVLTAQHAVGGGGGCVAAAPHFCTCLVMGRCRQPLRLKIETKLTGLSIMLLLLVTTSSVNCFSVI